MTQEPGVRRPVGMEDESERGSLGMICKGGAREGSPPVRGRRARAGERPSARPPLRRRPRPCCTDAQTCSRIAR